MKNMKKLNKALSLTLAILMIALACPLSIFAEGEPIQLITYEADGTTPASTEVFTDLASAVNAVDKGANQTIKLLDDISVSAGIVPSWLGEYDPDDMRTVKIDGRKADDSGNYQITVGNHLFFNNMAYYNLEMSNVDMVFNAVGIDGIFNWEAQCNTGNANKNSQAQTTKFTNCTVSIPDGNASDTGGGGNLFKLKGNGNTSTVADEYTLIFDGCTITDNSANIALIHHGAKADIQVKDTVITHKGGTSQNANYAILTFNHSNTSATVSVTGSSVLESALQATGGATSEIFTLQSANQGVDVTLGAGVVLYLNSVETRTTNRFATESASIQIVDQGAVWKASATMVKNGVTLPGNVKTSAESTYTYSWKVGNTELTSSIYKDEAANADVIFTGVSSDPRDNPANVAYIAGATEAENQYFTSFASAVGGATNGSVIYLLRDINEAFDCLTPPSGISFTVDGAKTGGGVYKITNTHTTSGRYFMECGSANITLKNLEIDSDKGLRFHGTGAGEFSTTLDNVKLSVDAGLAMKIGENTLGAYENSRTFNVTIQNSTITSAAADAVINAGLPSLFNIVVKNSTIEQTKSTGGDNGYVFNLFNKNGGTLDLQAGTVIKNSASTGSTSGIISVHDQSLRNASTDPWTPCPMTGNVTLTMASGVQLILSSANATTNKYLNNGNSKLTVTDNGAVWKAAADTVKKGVTLPDLGTGKAWFVGGNAVANDYLDANATGEVTFVPGTLDTSDEMNNPNNLVYTEVGGTKTFYSSLSAAINAVGTGDSPVIHLLRDIAVTSTITPSWLGEYDPANMRTVKIDGRKADNSGNYTITVSEKFFNNMAYYNLEMSNVNMIFNAVGVDGVFAWEAQCNTGNANRSSQTQTTKFTNCTFTAPDGNALDSGAGGNFFKLKGNGKDGANGAGDLDVYNLIFDGCTMVENAGNILIVHHGASANITVKDTHIKHTGGATSSNVSVFKFFDCDGVTLRITGSSVIESALPEAAPNADTYMIYWMGSVDTEATHKLILDSTVTLYLNSAADRTDNQWINNAISNKLVIEDAGATYKASATMLKSGVNLPVLNTRAGVYLGWSDGTSLISAGGVKYTVANATEDGSFSPVKAGTFKMLSGASIHTSGDYGIRFETEVSDDIVAMLGDRISLHMWIMPKALLGNNAFVKTSLYEGEYMTFDLGADQITGQGTGTTIYSGDLLGIPKRLGGVTTEFTARAFLKITYADSSTAYIYSEYDATANTRSVYQVAKAAYEYGITDNATINEILALKG